MQLILEKYTKIQNNNHELAWLVLHDALQLFTYFGIVIGLHPIGTA